MRVSPIGLSNLRNWCVVLSDLGVKGHVDDLQVVVGSCGNPVGI